jgi:hypothetical protein
MDYPFTKISPKANSRRTFENHLPHVNQTLPEFFRVLAIANQSIAQKDMYGSPMGIRQDLGVESALKLMLMACHNDRVIHAQQRPLEIIDVLRKLVLQWFALGHSLESCLFFGYYFYNQQSQAVYTVKNAMQQMDLLISPQGNANTNSEVAQLLSPTHSQRWYQGSQGMGDKLFDIFISNKDFLRTDLPLPGFHIHFKHSFRFDLRAPLFMDPSEVELALPKDGKVITSCPRCGQKCRGPAFDHMDITCPSCHQHWQQHT